MPMRDRPITRMLLHDSAHIICLNEADAFLDPQGAHSLVHHLRIQGNCDQPIACFVRGNKHARVELLARYISTRSQNWGTTFGMFRCFFGTKIACIDPEYDTPTFDCLATTGPHMSKENLKHYVGERLPPRTSIQTYGRNKEIVVRSSFRRALDSPQPASQQASCKTATESQTVQDGRLAASSG